LIKSCQNPDFGIAQCFTIWYDKKKTEVKIVRLQINESKNAASFYVVKSISEKGKRTNKVVEKLGTQAELERKLVGKAPIEWAKEYVAELTRKEKEQEREVLIKYSPKKSIEKNEQRSYNGGYLFLQKIYYELKLDKICKTIKSKYNFEYDLNSIVSRLLYSRIIYPASKHATNQLSERFIEAPKFELHHIYRALEVISKETEYIQSELYKNRVSLTRQKSKILYYDCTNYFFEIEQEEGLKQYGISKEHRANPIVQMGLFMDGEGIPLAFNINSGSTNEQTTLKPLEKQILSDFGLDKFVVCTDAGLTSKANRKFNDMGGRAFITTQSVKLLKSYLKEWALNPQGWKICGDNKIYDISKKDEEQDKDKIYFKETWINDDEIEQRLIVTFSLKYRDYQRNIRNSQIERAQKVIDTNPTKLKKANQNDYKRFITKTSCTKEGEVADKEIYSINTDVIASEERYDGFYGVCTNLEDDVNHIIKINKRRWEIEESFRIMKSEFKARPVYLKRDDRIIAHFTTCFISLIIYRLLEKRLGEKYTAHEIIDGLRIFSFYSIKGEGYIPTYTRTDFTDDLHDVFGFRTDFQIVNNLYMKNIFKITKS